MSESSLSSSSFSIEGGGGGGGVSLPFSDDTGETCVDATGMVASSALMLSAAPCRTQNCQAHAPALQFSVRGQAQARELRKEVERRTESVTLKGEQRLAL
jgi:hypothetical protein